MTERNPAWLPIVRVEPDPVERILKTLWSYEATPVRFCQTQRYSLVLTEPRQP